MSSTHRKVSSDADSQEAIFAFLSRRGVVGPGQPEIHDTHIARVFVGGDRALKVKRAVKLPFLDFSTLALRHAACLSEMAVNKDNAPEIYLGVTAITDEGEGRLAIGGQGAVVEWAVEMRAFATADLLSVRAAATPLDAALMRDTADAIHAMHQRAKVQRDVDLDAKMRAIVAEVSGVLASEPTLIDPEDVRSWQDACHREIEQRRGQLAARIAADCVRRCHGDLHLANIVVWRGRATLFDALEFSDEMATVDTLYDLAFLLMDLGHHDQRAAANVVLNRYLWRSGVIADVQALALLPLYISCRAGIRAMVAATRAGTAGRTRDQQEEDGTAARRYLAEAIVALRPAPPRLVAVGGLSGTGKSTLAAQIAPHIGGTCGALHLRSDLERKAMMGVDETARLPAEHYTPENARRVYDRLVARTRAALSAGHSVIVDAVFATPQERAIVEEAAANHGAAFQGLWLEASADVLRNRVGARRGDASDATPEVVDRQLGYDIGALTWRRVPAGGAIEETFLAAADALGLEPRAR